MYLAQKQLSSVGNKLLPETTNLTSWLVSPTTDGKTISNSQGTDAKLTGINCLSFDGSGDRVTINSVNDIDLIADADNHFGACTITTTFMQTSAGTQVIHACGAASYRLYTQDGKFKINADGVERFDVEQNKLYKSTITFDATGAATNFVLENITDGTTETNNSTTSAAGGHNGSSTLQIGARSNGLVFVGAILDFSITNSSVGANIHLPMQEGSGSVAYDISGNGANGTITGASAGIIGEVVSHNTLYGFTTDSAVKVPALINKTKQVATFDGVADHVDFASALLDSASTFTVRVDINKYIRTVGSNAWVVGGQADKNFGLNKNNHIFYRDDDNTYLEFDGSGGTTDTSNIDLDGKSIVIKGSSDVIELFIDTVSYGTVTAGSGKGLYYAARYGLGYSTTAHAFKGSLSRVALWNTANDGQDLSTALVNHEFQSDVGSTTVQDTTANNNDGTVTVGSGGTSTFWGRRVVDSSGSIVSADYANGNTTVGNPSGFVHNQSEVGFDLVTTDKNSANILGLTNASETQDFAREDSNGNVIQYLQYSSAISDSTSLTRTRAYVG